jgi:hypothetical protein
VKIFKEWVFSSIHHDMDRRLEYAVNAQNSETEKRTFEDLLVNFKRREDQRVGEGSGTDAVTIPAAFQAR